MNECYLEILWVKSFLLYGTSDCLKKMVFEVKLDYGSNL